MKNSKRKVHLNAKGEPCSCGFTSHLELDKESKWKIAGSKLDWIIDRGDKVLQTEEGKEFLNLIK